MDGVALTLITEEDLRDHLGVEQPLVRKKIMHWQDSLLQQFNQYLSQNKADPKIVKWQLDEKEDKKKVETVAKKEVEKKVEKIVEKKANPNCNFFDDDMDDFSLDDIKASESGSEQSKEEDKTEVHRMVIQPTHQEVPTMIIQSLDEQSILTKSEFQVSQEGATLGRHLTNSIPLQEQSVSRFHARLFWQDD